MKPRPPRKPRTRREPARGTMPPEVPEVTAAPASAVAVEPDPIPEDIRRMLEAAYT